MYNTQEKFVRSVNLEKSETCFYNVHEGLI